MAANVLNQPQATVQAAGANIIAPKTTTATTPAPVTNTTTPSTASAPKDPLNEILYLKQQWQKAADSGNAGLQSWAEQQAKQYYSQLDPNTAKAAQSMSADVFSQEMGNLKSGTYANPGQQAAGGTSSGANGGTGMTGSYNEMLMQLFGQMNGTDQSTMNSASVDAQKAYQEQLRKYQELMNQYTTQQQGELDSINNKFNDSKSQLEDQSFQNWLSARQNIANKGLAGSGLEQDSNTRLGLARNKSLAALQADSLDAINNVNRTYGDKLSQAAADKAATSLSDLQQQYFKQYSDANRNSMMDQAKLYAQLIGQALPYDFQSADNAANNGYKYDELATNTKYNYDKMTVEAKQFYDKLSSDEKQFYDKLASDYGIQLTSIMGYDSQGRPTLDMKKLEEQIRSNKAGEQLSYDSLSAQVSQWAQQNQLDASKLTLDTQEFSHKIDYDNQMIKQAGANLQNDSDRFILDGLQTQLSQVASIIASKQKTLKSGQTLPANDPDVTNYNKIMNAINGLITSRSAPTSSGNGAFNEGAKVSGDYSSQINSAAAKYGVDAKLVKAVATQESSLGKASSNVMQVNGMNDSGADASINQGTSMLASYVKKYGSVEWALAAYNMGPGIINWAKNNGYSDPRKAMAAFSTYQKQKNGYKVYGDPEYIDHVLRYYK
jgi:hypothetical protein